MRMTALRALELGWCVIPVKLDKRPYFRWERFQTIRPDTNMIAAWHRQYKPPAWAVVTGSISGIVILDFDGDEGRATLSALGLEPHVRTGSGGCHVYVEHPGWPIKTLNGQSKRQLGELYPGLDVRGDGGYAVFCGRNDKGKYEWLRDPTPHPISALIQELQNYLGLRKLADHPPDAGNSAPTHLVEAALERSVNGRNDAGFWLACQLRDIGLGSDEAEEIMMAYQASVGGANTKGHTEPYSVEEALASLRQAYSREPREPLERIRIVCGADSDSASGDAGTDDLPPIKARPWPEPLAPEVFRGLAGEFIRLVDPHTEADPAALLFSYFVGFGNIIGRGAHFVAESDRHYMNLFVVQVGLTSKGRKGSSLGQVMRLLREINPDWAGSRVQSGLSSGEGLIWAVRDPIQKEEPIRENKQVTGYQSVTIDSGVGDKRLLVVEGEFASTLRVMARDGNTLSAVIRSAWDSGDLRVLTKTSPAQATGAHISIIGHITRDELLRYLDSTEAGNGFGNRFLWVCVRRSKVLPEGGVVPEESLAAYTRKLLTAVAFAQNVGEMTRDANARKLWHQVYPGLSEGKPGLLGAMIARAEAQVMRVACLYALLDCSPVIREEHLRAALAVWHYAEESARFIFGESLGDPVADELLRVLRSAPEGLTRTQISKAFGRNKSASEIGRAMGALRERGLVRSRRERSVGERGIERWFAAEQGAPQQQHSRYEINENNEIGGAEDGVNSLNSSISYADQAEDGSPEQFDDWEVI